MLWPDPAPAASAFCETGITPTTADPVILEIVTREHRRIDLLPTRTASFVPRVLRHPPNGTRVSGWRPTRNGTRAPRVQVQHWMGHADVQTTMRYLHHKSRGDEATMLAEAFKVAAPASGPQASGLLATDTAFRTDAGEEAKTPLASAFSRNETEPVALF